MRVLIVDDDSLARSALTRLCSAHADIQEILEADCGRAAIQTIQTEKPDVMLLDVELQDMSGFDVIEAIEPQDAPVTIMVTAHSQHAVKAFERSVLDFVTKPVDEQRFNLSIEKVRTRRASSLLSDLRADLAAEMRSMLSTEQPGKTRLPRRLLGEKAHRLYFIETEIIDFIEADGNYVKIHVGENSYISRNTVKHLADSLAPLGFVRIERSLLVNLHHVAFAERVGHGAFALTLSTGQRLVSTPTYRKRILDALQ
jgi:two-component system LytT family response regulator